MSSVLIIVGAGYTIHRFGTITAIGEAALKPNQQTWGGGIAHDWFYSQQRTSKVFHTYVKSVLSTGTQQKRREAKKGFL
jgi:hypothetical protein